MDAWDAIFGKFVEHYQIIFKFEPVARSKRGATNLGKDGYHHILICPHKNKTEAAIFLTAAHEVAEIEADVSGMRFGSEYSKERWCTNRAKEILLPPEQLRVALRFTEDPVMIQKLYAPYASVSMIEEQIKKLLCKTFNIA